MRSLSTSEPRLSKVILHIGPVPPPTGGVALALQSILRSSSLQHYVHRVFNTSDGRHTEKVGRKSVTLKRTWRRLSMAAAIAKLVLCERPDLVHFQCGSESGLNIAGDVLMLWASRLAGAPVILHLHVDPATADLPGSRKLGQWLFRQLLSPVHSIFVLTEKYRSFLESQVKVARPIYVVPNMCDETLLNVSKEEQNTPTVVRVLFLGRLTEAKGIFDLLKVAARLHKANSFIHFDVAGLPSTPDEKQRIDDNVEQEHLHDTVTFHGLVTDKAKKSLFENADIVFIPSYGESFGIVAIEGMAAALPVLGTEVGGLQSIILPGETGYLVAPGDIEGMVTCLLELACNTRLRLQMGYAGRRHFQAHYTSERIGSICDAAYRRALKET